MPLTVAEALPGTEPQAGAERRALRVAFVVLLVAATVGQRIGVNFGSYSLNAALPAMYALLFVAALSGALVISLERLVLYGLCLCVGFASAALNAPRGSLPSLALLVVIYAPIVFGLREGAFRPAAREWSFEAFSNVALFCGLAGIVQFYAQFVIHAGWLFDFTPYLPTALRGPSGYNTVIAVGSLYKSNGFFFHEPSDFSFLMALAAIVEWSGRRRLVRLACFGLALLLTYSGTGLGALAIGFLFPLGPKTFLRVALLGFAAALALWLLGDALNLSFTLGRLAEFGSERSSAYHRYIAPLRLIGDNFDAASFTGWLGFGPGTIQRAKANYDFHDPTWAKLMFEYGVLGTLAVVALFARALARAEVPAEVRATLFFSWLVLGGHLLAPEHDYLCLALVTLLPVALGRRERVPTPVSSRVFPAHDLRLEQT